jgi:hypothetical protein
MKIVKHFLFLGTLLTLPSCSPNYSHQQLKPNPLQLREVQSRTFEECDTKSVMKAMINVLQDEGYIVRNAVLDLGLITAEKSVDVEVKNEESALTSMLKGSEPCITKHAVLEVSANVSNFGTDTKVRLNFQRKTYDNHGGVMAVNQVMDATHYQSFFAKVSKGIFLQSENL